MRDSRLRRLGLLLLFGLAYAVARRVSFAFAITPPGIAALWLPAGLLLGVLLRRPLAEWPALFAAALVASFAAISTPGPWSGTLLFAGAALVDAAVSGLIIRRLVGISPRLDRLREVFALALVPSLIGEPIAATIAAAGQQYLFHTHNFWQVWTVWWSANTLGDLIGAPLVLTAPARWRWPRGADTRRAIGLAGLTALVAAVTFVLFTHPLTLDSGPALGWIAFPLIALTAVRFGPIGAASSSAAYGLIGMWGTVRGHGPFASLAATAADRILWLNLFLQFTIFAALVLAAADSEHRQVVRALRESEGKYRSIFENALDAIFRTTPDGRYAEANPATAQMLGYESPEQLMREVIDVTEIYADPEQRREILRRLQADGQIPAIEVEVRRRDGSTAWLAMSLQVVRDPDGGVRFVEGVAEDVTERRASKEQSDHLQRQLFQAQKMESLGTLAGGIAHDFNNILAAIVGMIDLAALTLPEEHRARRHIGDALRASERAGELIDRVLTFSQQHAEVSRAEDLVPIATEVARLMRAALPPTVRIETSFAPDVPAVLANATQLRQVLVNLMTNAGQAMREAGGELRVALDVVVPDEELRRDAPRLHPAPHVRITVSDTGDGMDARTM
ncbi:MAG: MASE1 domain-containing protein, partial [Gemmatimonadota bacterium]|nr:MASE1 domain-containing protein [Gemmatimonadota bacterium]